MGPLAYKVIFQKFATFDYIALLRLGRARARSRDDLARIEFD